MKKVLFATTALVATAGMAAADVTFGGYGRFGLLYNEGASDEVSITHRYRLQIDASAESDSGISFGARVRIQRNAGNDNGGFGNAQGINGARFFMRSGGLELGVGNIFGALESMPGMYPIDLGLTGLGYEYTAYNFRGDAYSSGGAGNSNDEGVEVMYSGGALSAHLSYSETDDRIAAHVAYSFGDWTVALGAQDSDSATDTEFVVSAGGSIGPADVTFAYADNGVSGDHWVIAGRFDVGASTNVEAYIADADYFTDTSYGIDFNHNMGGGTSLRGGIASLSSGNVRADLGVRFNF